MARTKSNPAPTNSGAQYEELVAPDGSGRTETPTTATADAQLRFRGWLPAEQAKAEAPQVDVDNTPKTEGTAG